MLQIETKLSITDLTEAQNICTLLTDQECSSIGHLTMEGFSADLQSRTQWEERMRDAMKLALQLKEEKTFPWPGASNVKFPLITVSAISFHSRIYPALITYPSIVSCCIYGDDPSGQLDTQGQLISEHLSWQVFNEDEDWESEQDKTFLVQAILGCAFKKTFFNRTLKRNDSELVMPSDLVVNYWTRSLDDAPRITHIRYVSPNFITTKEREGSYLPCDTAYATSQRPELLGPLAQVRNETQGTTPDSSDTQQPIILLEQLCWLDLDSDGYSEPYVATIRHDSSKLVRLVAAYHSDTIIYNSKHEITSIPADQPYTKYEFIPSPDGGFYPLGFGTLLGPLNKSIDTSLNQLIDAGTLKNAGGGFLGRGVTFKGGEYTVSPGKWARVNSTGDDLQKSIYPLPTPEPSSTLFQLLSLLIEYGEKLAGSTEATSGDNPGQNTKVGTMDSMLEQGLQIFSGIYKRTYRAMRDEFRKLYNLNRLYLNESQSFLHEGKRRTILSDAYSIPNTSLTLAADPNYMSDSQRQRQAQLVKTSAATSPQLYNILEVERWFLRTMKVPAIDTLLVKEIPPPSPPVELQIEQLRMQTAQAKLQLEQSKLQASQSSEAATFQLKLIELQQEAELSNAKILNLQAQALLYTEQAGTAQQDAEISVINAEIGAAKLHHDSLLKSIKILSDIQLGHKKIAADKETASMKQASST